MEDSHVYITPFFTSKAVSLQSQDVKSVPSIAPEYRSFDA